MFLECPATNGRSALCDVNFINLNKVSDVQVVREANSVPPPPHSLSVQRVRLFHILIALRKILVMMKYFPNS